MFEFNQASENTAASFQDCDSIGFVLLDVHLRGAIFVQKRQGPTGLVRIADRSNVLLVHPFLQDFKLLDRRGGPDQPELLFALLLIKYEISALGDLDFLPWIEPRLAIAASRRREQRVQVRFLGGGSGSLVENV